MTTLKTDFWGLENFYYDSHKNFSNNIDNLIYQNDGFSNYSKEGISSFLTYRYPIATYTMFEDFKRLDSSVIFENDKQTPYWRPTSQEQTTSEEVAIIKIRELLKKSIANLVKGKKRIGAMLSGGLDSSLIVAMLKKEFPEKEIYTYSVGFYGDDEFEFSDSVAKEFSTNHKKFILGLDDITDSSEHSIINALIRKKAAPLHPNELPLAIAQQQAKLDCCDIVLCGEGADDIFGGYGRNLRMYLNFDKQKSTFLEKILADYRYFSIEERQRLIRPEFLVSDITLSEKIMHECSSIDIRNQMLYFIQRLHTKGLIERGMNALAFNGFSAGFPFIDMDLVNYANSLPFSMKVKYNDGFSDCDFQNVNYKDVSEKYDTPKYILKKMAEQYLSTDIIYRKKYGFPVPFEKWLANTNILELDNTVFNSSDVSYLNGWKKYMVINLNTFIKIFNKYRK